MREQRRRRGRGGSLASQQGVSSTPSSSRALSLLRCALFTLGSAPPLLSRFQVPVFSFLSLLSLPLVSSLSRCAFSAHWSCARCWRRLLRRWRRSKPRRPLLRKERNSRPPHKLNNNNNNNNLSNNPDSNNPYSSSSRRKCSPRALCSRSNSQSSSNHNSRKECSNLVQRSEHNKAREHAT